MIFDSLTATFGCLNHATLELKDGLNIIQAPNESGKSTWLAFIRTMLYGLASRERGPLADKNRYAPWSGAAMQGRMDLTDGEHTIVLIRDTVRSAAPMGRFYAAYGGTSQQIPDMTGQNAGELLTGVPKAVFERSAFIQQSGLAVNQTAELERRITALLSSGEESSSYSEAQKQLRSALNQRRHNRTGLLPRTEAEIDTLRSQLEHLQTLHAQAESDRAALEAADSTLSAAEAGLAEHARMDVIEGKRAFFAAKTGLAQAEAEADALRSEIERSRIPPAEQLTRIKFNAANMLTTQVSMNHVQAQAEEAKQKTAACQAAVDAAAPFAPAEPDTAAEKVRSDTAHYYALMSHAAPSGFVIALLTALIAAASGGGAWYVQQNLTPAVSLPLALGSAGVITAAVAALLCLLRRSSVKHARAKAAALLAPYGVTEPNEIDVLLEQYRTVYNSFLAQKEAEAQINASWQNFYQTCKRLSAEILDETSAFCPGIENVHEISPLLDAGLQKWKTLQTLTDRTQQLRARCDALRSRLPDDAPLTPEEETLQRPAQSREQLAEKKRTAEETQRALRSRIDRARGEMDAIGDRIELEARLEELEGIRVRAQEEYDALELALQALEQANDTMQSRFSPALGRQAGEIFSAISGGRYHQILLDQSLHAAAQGDDAVPRDAALLSQGASDQLYLSVRLAICEQVLPPERHVPLLLDDALSNFDETRMAAALDWLLHEAENRQILLFTCQSREARYLETKYLQAPENVHIITLSERRWH